MSTMDAKKALVADAVKLIDVTKAELIWCSAIDELQEVIVATYEGGDCTEHKREWNTAVVDYSQEKGIDVTMTKARKPNWKSTSTALVNRLQKIAFSNVLAGVSDTTSGSTASRQRSSTSNSTVSGGSCLADSSDST